MDPVEDDLDDDVVPGEGGAGDPGVPVAERAHRVEEVRHRAHAGVEGGVGLVGRRVRVAARDGDLAPQQDLDERVGAGKLGCERDQADGPRVEQALEQFHVRISARGGRMDAEAQRGEERAFEMNAEDAGPVRLGRHLAEGGEELRLGGGDEGRKVGRDAGLEQRLTRASVPVDVGVERSTPANPLTWRSTKPGTAIPRPFGEVKP